MTTVKPIVEERQHHSWGLLVQGRPATPSEGRAQQYTRIGCKDTQSLITHNNGTCLEFGPWDLVDEFDATKPFYQQVLLIDTTIKDIQSVRIRHNDQVGDEVDVFKGFRTIPYTGEIHQHVYTSGDTYTQVPSYYANVSNTASMYSTTNKSDIIGEAHPGLSSDTRFGVLVPNQGQNQGRGGNSYRGSDRQNGRSNQHYGERGGYTQHLNRRGRRDMHFGRGQGRGEGRGDGRGNVRESARGGRNFASGGNHHNTSSAQNGNHQHREDDCDEERWWGQPAPREIQDGYQEEADRSYPGYDEDGSQYSSYKPYHKDDHTYLGPNGKEFPHLTPTHGQQAPIYPGLEEAYPLILPSNVVFMSYNGPINSYVHPVPIEGNRYGSSDLYQSMQRRVPLHDYTSSGVVYSPELEMESHVGGHSPYFVPGHDIGVDVSMRSDNGRDATNPRPRVVLPPATPGSQTYISSSDGHEGQLRANVYPPTPFGPSVGRSPMRTTTSEGSPLMRPRRHATDPHMTFAPLTHARTTSGSGTDLRRLATGNSGFAIAEPRSSPSASVFSPRSASPRNANMDALTARSSPGLSFSNPSAVGGPMTRNASSHELKYAGYSNPGKSIPSLGLVSRTSTPLANSGRRWFESRQFVPDGSRSSSPGIASPCQNSRIRVESRSEDGQM